MDFIATNGNRDMLLYGGQVCIYNNENDTFMSTMGSVLKTSNASYKGIGFLLGKHSNIFTIARDANWDDVVTNRSPNPTHYITFNFDTKEADIDMDLNVSNINMRNHNLRNVNEFFKLFILESNIHTVSFCYDSLSIMRFFNFYKT